MAGAKEFNKLYLEHIDFVTYFCRAHFRLDWEAAQDIAQNAFLKAHEKLDSLRDRSKFKPWILAIAKNEAMSHFRAQKRQGEVLRSQKSEEEGEEQGSREVEVRFVSNFLKALPSDRNNLIFKAFYEEGKSTAQISENFQVPQSTVTTVISRLRQKFKTHLVEEIVKLREGRVP